jgi:hypothetical protein
MQLTIEVRHSRRQRPCSTERAYEDYQSQETKTRGGCCLHRFVRQFFFHFETYIVGWPPLAMKTTGQYRISPTNSTGNKAMRKG